MHSRLQCDVRTWSSYDAKKGELRVTLRRVPSHTGNPGNETADVMAKQGASMTVAADVTQAAAATFATHVCEDRRIRAAIHTDRRGSSDDDASQNQSAYQNQSALSALMIMGS